MEIKDFIEKAIEGGWKSNRPYIQNNVPDVQAREVLAMMNKEEVLLDPLAWQAVGKVEGWSTVGMTNRSPMGSHLPTGEWLYRWHLMIDALAEGKTIDDFLKTL